jgi:hypothetical protein
LAECEPGITDRRRASVHMPTPTTVTTVVKIAASLTSSRTSFFMTERVQHRACHSMTALWSR